MEIQEQGRLHVEGSNAQRGDPSYHVGGGAGGVIQIISSKGSLAAGTSFLKPGINAGTCCDAAEYGYVFVSGIKCINLLINHLKYSQLSRKRTPSGIEKSLRWYSCPLTIIIPISGHERKIGWMSAYGRVNSGC